MRNAYPRRCRPCFLGKPLFSPLNLEIASGEICVLSAPSGAGKSTLLRWIAGIPTEGVEAEGHIWLKGRQIDSLPAERRRVGLMFQQPLLFPHLSVGDNLGFGLPASVRGGGAQISNSRGLAHSRTGGDGDARSRNPFRGATSPHRTASNLASRARSPVARRAFFQPG